MYRCPACRTRRDDYRLFTRHLRESGHRLCHCGGYHYAHRPGSPYCEQNPMSELNAAARRGEADDVLLDIAAHLAWTVPAKPGGKKPPF